MATLIRRDLSRSWRSGGVWIPVIFFVLVATLFPFAIGPDAAVLRRIGVGTAWVAALLAALMPVDRLVAPDLEAGVLDQLAIRGVSEEAIAAARLAAHWLSFGPFLMLALLPAAALLRLSTEALLRLEITLLIGTPGLAGLTLATSALLAGLRGSGVLAGVLMLPLAVPILIFGAADGPGALKLLGACSLVITAGSVFVAGSAMRMARLA